MEDQDLINYPNMEKPPRPRKELRQGFSTGTAAAAAAQGALRELLGLLCPETVEVDLPGGGSLFIPLHYYRRNGDSGLAAVIKDAGDDPDVTNGAEIGARVRLLASGHEGKEEIRFRSGEGVGRVTKPGLALAVGEPAINPVPRKMIRRGLEKVWQEVYPGRPMRLEVEIFVPRGEEMARHTLNPRLGILGGLSILGTTGLVKPFSHAAYRATIAASLKVAQALGLQKIVFSTGGRSEKYMQALLPEPEEAFVQMGDYVRFALKTAANLKFREITVGAFFGKALKIAQGWGHTHASRGLADLKKLGRLTAENTGDARLAEEVSRANTARQALEILLAAEARLVLAAVGEGMLAALRDYAGLGPKLAAVILDFAGAPLWRGESVGRLE